MLTDFQKPFNSGLSSKHVMKWLKMRHISNASPHHLVKRKYQKTSDILKVSSLRPNLNLLHYRLQLFD